MSRALEAGAVPGESDTCFRAWAPQATQVALRLFEGAARPLATLPMSSIGDGWHERRVERAGPGTLYKFVVDGRELPDPYARFLPFGVDGPAEVVARSRAEPLKRPLSAWQDAVVYELHVGTFTPAGTYQAARERLGHLADLGVTTIELMPVAAFPGRHGWGYDGVAHFAPFAGYGTPGDLRALIADAHARGMSVLLDAVYNHFGPSGNHLRDYAQDYFSTATDNPWGESPNFACEPMRRYVLDSARMWFEQYGIDGLRLDATHALQDSSRRHILQELTTLAHGLESPRLVIAEDDRNDPALVSEQGVDAVWADDFHHHIHVILTGERDGYYAAYEPSVQTLARTIERGWLYEGQHYSPWGRPRGRPSTPLQPRHLVLCVQNHDQVGNRALGTRLASEAGPAAELAATVVMLFLPYVPLLFMGQEWGASSPFLFFSDHEPALGRLVSEGRRKEFARFDAFASPADANRIPDPQAVSTFEKSRLSWAELNQPLHRATLEHVRKMLQLRRVDPVLRAHARADDLRARGSGDLLFVRRQSQAGDRTLVANLGKQAADLPHAGTPILSVGDVAATRLGPFSVAVWADGAPAWPNDAA